MTRRFPFAPRAGRLFALVALAVLTVAVTQAIAASYQYFGGSDCCGHRKASSIYVYETNNIAVVVLPPGGQQVLCVQEHVYPNWPSRNGSFFDGYKCGPGSTGHVLNGANVDQAYCWNSSGSATFGCYEDY